MVGWGISNSMNMSLSKLWELVMPSIHLVLCCPLLLRPSIYSRSFQISQFFTSGGQSIGVSASASVLPIEYSGLISFRMDWLALLAVVQSLSHIRLFAIPWTAAHQASLSFTISQSLLKLVSIEPVMPSNHLIPCHPLLLLPPIFPSIKAFSNESALHIMWPKD